MGTAQVRPEYAHLYPALARGRWYPVVGGGGSEDGRAVRVEAAAGPIEVAAEHVVRRRAVAAG